MSDSCGARTGISLVMGTIGCCELVAGHAGKHQEQRQDNGGPHQWPNTEKENAWHSATN